MNQWFRDVDICIAGLAFISGWISPRKHYYVQFVKAEYHKNHSFQFILKETMKIQGNHLYLLNHVGRSKDRKYQRGRLDSDKAQFLTKILLKEVGFLGTIIRGAALWWDLAFFQHSLLWTLHGMIYLDLMRTEGRQVLMLETMRKAESSSYRDCCWSSCFSCSWVLYSSEATCF